MTPDELQWHLAWRGAVVVVRGPEEALRAIGVIGEKRELPAVPVMTKGEA